MKIKKMKSHLAVKKAFLIIVLSGITMFTFAEDTVGFSNNIITETNSTGTAVIATIKTTVKITGWDGNKPLFIGQVLGCAKGQGSSANCCATTGWGADPSLSNCPDNAKLLAEARNEGRAAYIGDTCIVNKDGTCSVPISVYCVFENPMAYQVQIQGRQKQLGINFGTPDKPDCSGITADQIKKLDLTVMNFQATNS